MRAFDRGASTVAATLDAVMDYHQFLVRGDGNGAEHQDKGLERPPRWSSARSNTNPGKSAAAMCAAASASK
jgi:hypothetical protein